MTHLDCILLPPTPDESDEETEESSESLPESLEDPPPQNLELMVGLFAARSAVRGAREMRLNEDEEESHPSARQKLTLGEEGKERGRRGGGGGP